LTYTPTPDDRSSLVIIKSFAYRGLTRTFANRYHFEGDTPEDNAAWTTLADNVVTAEKAIYPSGVTIVEAVGNDHTTASLTNLHGDAVFTKTYTTAGTGSFEATGTRMPGDCAALLRYSTLARSHKNHPVYLFNYFHGCYDDDTGYDLLNLVQKAAIEAYGTAWITGFTDGTGARERCGPHGAGATSRRVDPSIRHRDFPA
jgi:hypothetical protein